MGSGHLLAIGRALALVAMVFALVGIAVSFSSYAASEFSLENTDISTHTKAFCSQKESMLYCEDKLVASVQNEERVIETSPITGNAFIETETL